jgi:hypothetical protein
MMKSKTILRKRLMWQRRKKTRMKIRQRVRRRGVKEAWEKEEV